MKTKLTMASMALGGMLAGILLTLTFLNGSRAHAQGPLTPPGGSAFLQVPPIPSIPTIRNLQCNRIPTMNNVWRLLWQADTADGKATIYWEDGGPIQIFPHFH
ncbi:MAG TPA: hypothetical protein VKU00_18290 [Chthonomonadaceae bacterium]|nr:hypothetical protein [Chthonomonadaceae bacterium]